MDHVCIRRRPYLSSYVGCRSQVCAKSFSRQRLLRMSLSASDYMQGVKDICVSVLKNETSFLLDAATIIFLFPDINNYLVTGDSLKTFNPI